MPSSIHIDASMDWGDGQTQSLGLALAIAARGEETWFITQPGSELAARLKGTYLTWEALPLRGLGGLVSAPRLARRLAELRPDIVHIHESTSHVAAGIAARLAAREHANRDSDVVPTKLRIVVTRHTESALRAGRLSLAKYHLWCDRLVCISDAARDSCSKAGLPESLLTVVPDSASRHFDPRIVERMLAVYEEALAVTPRRA